MLNRASEATNMLKEHIENNDVIRLISHNDADGISAAAVIANALKEEGAQFHTTIVPRLKDDVVNQLRHEQYNLFIFSDMGSAYIRELNSFKSDVIVADHHQVSDVEADSNLVHVNPHLFEIDGSKDLSGAGSAYLTVRDLNKKHLAYFALTGAFGDMQGQDGFTGVNSFIVNDAKAACDIELHSLDDAAANGFYIMLSNNVGGAVFINGSVYMGDDYRSGEVGHLNIHPGGLPCYCGQRGCVDPYCSATVLTAISNGNLEEFFRLLGQNNEAALSVWSVYLEHLALAIRNVRVLLDCPIIIGGYVGAYIDKYLHELKQLLDRYNSFDKNSDYVVACKYKTESIAAGAALSFIKEFLSTI